MGTADRPDEPERPTQDQDLYVYAEETARYCYELLTGDWLLE